MNSKTTTTASEILDPFGYSAGLPDMLEHMPIVRQSAKKAMRNEGGEDDIDLSQYKKMVIQLTDRQDIAALPGAQLIRSAAADIVRQTPAGAALRKTLNAIPIPGIGGRISSGYLVIVENTGWLLVVDSASKATVKTADHRTTLHNAFTDALCRLINRYQVKNLYSRMDRIVRTAPMATMLATTCREHGTKVHTDMGTFDLSDTAGTQNFIIFSQFIQMSLQATVAGLTKGWHALALEGRWPKGEGQLPAMGYKFASDVDPLPVPNPDVYEMVAKVVEWAADDSISYSEIANRLAKDYNWVSGVAKSRSGQSSIKDLRYPSAAVKNLLISGLPLWLTGVYRYDAEISYWLSVAELNEKVAQRIEKSGNTRTTTFDISFNHPDDAIYPGLNRDTVIAAMRRLAATSETTKAALIKNVVDAKRSEIAAELATVTPRKTTTGGKGSTDADRKPLSGIAEWSAGGTQYALSSKHSTHYVLVKRDEQESLDRNGNRKGWHDNERNVIGVVNPKELHESLAVAVVNALETGVTWARGVVNDLPENITADDMQNYAKTIADLEKSAERIDAKLDVALEAGAKRKAAELMAESETVAKQIDDMRSEMATAQAALANRRLLDAESVVYAEKIAVAMAALADTDSVAPRALNDTLKTIISDMRLELCKSDTALNVAVKVQVASSDGEITLGPIEFQVTNRRRVSKESRGSLMFTGMFRDGKNLSEVAEEYGYTDIKSAQRRVAAELKKANLVPVKGMRAALIDTPIGDIRRVIWAAYEAKTSGKAFTIPADIDPAWAAHIRATYLDPKAVWGLTWVADSHGPARAAVAAAQVGGDNGVSWVTLIKEILPQSGYTVGKILEVELVNGKNQDRQNSAVKTVPYEPVLERSEPWHRFADRKVYARKCPYCGTRTLTHILRAPEVPGGMLCTNCRHTPSLPLVEFPAEYMRRWAGPRGYGNGKTTAVRSGTVEE